MKERFVHLGDSMPWFIPRLVAQRAMVCTGPKPVVGRKVYVGPCATLVGLLYEWCGWPTEDC